MSLAMTSAKMLILSTIDIGLMPSKVIHSNFLSRRNFFASSTDHTQLLATSQIHKLASKDKESGECIDQFVLAANGMDRQTVQAVPQLHLARLFVKGNVMYGAKVVNRTLGSPLNVCGRLVEAALQDIRSTNGLTVAVHGKSTLHGMSDWVLPLLQSFQTEQTSSTTTIAASSASLMRQLEEKELAILKSMAEGKASFNNNIDEQPQQEKLKSVWEQLAVDFVGEQTRLGQGEVALYSSKGGTLESIQHLADTSEFQDTCAGSMALFTFFR